MEEKFLSKFRKSWTHLLSIWDHIGIHGDQRQERTDVVMCHLETLLDEMVTEEEGLRKRLLQSVENCTQEMSKLCKELNVPPFEPEENLSLLKLESELRTRVEALAQERHQRLKVLKRLREEEQKLCRKLCISEHILPSGIPSKEDLHELEQHVKMLNKEKECRHMKFVTMKQEIIKLMDKLEHSPSTQLERDLICEDDDEFLLSQDNLTAISKLQENLQIQYQKVETLCKELWDRLQTLWDRLNIPQVDRKLFLVGYLGPRPSAMRSLKEEIANCEAIKRQNIQKFVEKMREELISWWDKCYISKEERKTFTAFYSDDFTEELLEAHDAEVEKMRQIYENYKELFIRVSKRQQLWNRMLEFEKKASDPSRFNNRGGALLQEEKERKKLLKQLPLLEKELMSYIKEWEEKEGKEFCVYGKNFSNYITEQWDQHQTEKENEKIERQRLKARLLEEELACGSRPTPIKRRLVTTPSKTPNKLQRLGGPNGTPNHFYPMSSLAVPYSPAPVTPSRRRSPRLQYKHPRTPNKPKTPNKLTPMKMIAGKPTREVLGQKNDNQIIDTNDKKMEKSKQCISPTPSLVSITYSEFTTDLNHTDRINTRSSTIWSSQKKKVRGSKLSPQKFTSSSRSPYRKSPKLTPARKNLGLPFLI